MVPNLPLARDSRSMDRVRRTVSAKPSQSSRHGCTPPPTSYWCCCASSTIARAGTAASSRAHTGSTGARASTSAPPARSCVWRRHWLRCRSRVPRCSAARSRTRRCARSRAWPLRRTKRRSSTWHCAARRRTSSGSCAPGVGSIGWRPPERRKRGTSGVSSPPGWMTMGWS